MLASSSTIAISIDAVNQLDTEAFLARFGGVYEHSPWVAQAVESQRPFASRKVLEQSMRHVVEAATDEQRLEILKSHPEFAGRAASEGSLTAESTMEQGRLSLNSLQGEQLQRMRDFNAHFMNTFGFPGIVAVRLHKSVDDIFEQLQRRSNNSPSDEAGEAIEQVFHIVKFRLDDLIL